MGADQLNSLQFQRFAIAEKIPLFARNASTCNIGFCTVDGTHGPSVSFPVIRQGN